MARTAIILFSSLLLLAACSAPPNWLTVTSFSPESDATGVELDAPVEVTFAGALASLAGDDVELLLDGASVGTPAEIGADGRTATVRVDGGMDALTTYTVRVHEGIAAEDGRTLAASLEYAFTTGTGAGAIEEGGEEPPLDPGDDGDTGEDGETGDDGETGETGEDGDTGDDGESGDDGDEPGTDTGPAPVITGRFPVDDASGVSVSADIHVAFEAAMDPTSFEAADALVVMAGDDRVEGVVEYRDGEEGDHIAVFVPDALLAFDTDYEVVLSGDVRSLGGTALGDDDVWSFRTATEDVPYVTVKPRTIEDGVIRVEFSEALARAEGDIPHGAFKVVPKDVKGTATYTVETSPEGETLYVVTYVFDRADIKEWYWVKLDGLATADDNLLVDEWRVFRD